MTTSDDEGTPKGDLPWNFDLRDYEIIEEPTPRDETPRQFLLRTTGKDIPELTYYDGRDFSWQEVNDMGATPSIMDIWQRFSQPSIQLRRVDG